MQACLAPDPRPTPAGTPSDDLDRTAPASRNSEPDTASLVEAARAGDPDAWAEIFARYDVVVRSAVASFRLRDADAADAAQNTWLKTVERLGDVREPARLGGWMKTTAQRECLALLRRGNRESPADIDMTALVTDAPGPEARLLDAEESDAVDAALERLTDRGRKLIHAMFYLPKVGYAELAAATGMPLGSIGPTRGRALQVLRQALEQAGFGY